MATVTLSLLAGAAAQFFDNSGNPLTGGYLYTYSAGTTTPLETYTSNLGTVYHSNPIVLDAAGRVNEIWLTNGFGYKFVLKDSNNVLIGTYDNIPSSSQPPISNDASSIYYEFGQNTNAGSFIVGETYAITFVGTTNFQTIGASSNTVGTHFTATGVGSGTGVAQFSRTVQSRLQDYVSIKDFGAACDGATDDTVAFQAAVDSLGDLSNVRRSGMTLVVPGPTIISDTIVIRQKSFILTGGGWGRLDDTNGRASYIRWEGDVNKPMIQLYNCSGGMRIQNIAIKGNTTNKPSAAIELYQGSGIINSDIYIENVSIGSEGAGDDPSYQFQYGIISTGLNANNAEQYFNKVKIYGCSEAGIQQSFQQNTNWNLNDINIGSCKYGVKLASGIVGLEWNFALNDVDIYMIGPVDSLGNSTNPQLKLNRYQSEQSGRICYIAGSGQLFIDCGSFGIGAQLNVDGKIINQPTQNASVQVTLRNFSFQQLTAPPTPPFMAFKSNPGGNGYRFLIFDGMRGWGNLSGGVNGLDVTTQTEVDWHYIYFREVSDTASAFPPKIAQQFLGQAGKNWDITAYQTSGSAPVARLYDDFIGSTLNTDIWNTRVGTDAQCSAAAIVSAIGGVIAMTAGDDAGGTMALNGTQLDSSLNWYPVNGSLIYEFRLKTSSTANVAIFFGLTDQNAALEMPFTLGAGNTLTSNASNAIGVLYDTAADTDNWWLVGVNNDVDATKQNTGVAPVANVYEKWHVDVSSYGEGRFYRNGVLIGTVMSPGTNTAVVLTPVIAAFSRAAATVTITCDKILVEQAEGA